MEKNTLAEELLASGIFVKGDESDAKNRTA